MATEQVEKDIYDIIHNIVEGALLAAKEKASILEGRTIQHALENYEKFSYDQYRNLYHCVHWYLVCDDTARINLVEGSSCELKDPEEKFDKRKKEGFTKAIIKEYNDWLTARYVEEQQTRRD